MAEAAQSGGWPRRLAGAVVCGILYFLVASPAANIEQSTTLAAIAWPAPTFMIALLWHRPAREWLPYLLAVFVAMMFVGDEDWLPILIDAGFALLNVAQIMACVLIGRRFVARDGQFDTLRKLSRFLLLLPLALIAVVAGIGATLATSVMHGEWWAEWRTLMVGNGLATLVLVPAFLAWARPARLPAGHDRVDLPSILSVFMAVCALLASVTFGFSEEVLRVLLSLALAGAALYGGMRSAALAMSASAVLAVLLTLYDLGPYHQDGLDSTWRLQIDLTGLAVLTFFIAVAVRERQALSIRMEQMRRFESLGLMAGGIAHDFNNVLGAAGGYAELAHERLAPGSPAQAPLQEVLSAVSRGRDLTEQILLAARRGDRQRAVLDLRDPVGEAVRLARPLCRDGIAIDFTPPAQALPVLAHPGQLTRVALNLIRNASLAARSKVTVSLHEGDAPSAALMVGDVPPEQAVWLEVADDGTGIAAEHMPRLFDPFFTTRGGPGGKGTGLGLAIVAGIATEHDGGVAVLSSPLGTLFRLLLPAGVEADLPAPAALAPMATEQAHDASPGRGRSVFVVDDDRALRELCEDWLAAMGFEPVGFGNPAEALAELALEPRAVDLLLTDLDMPQMRGDALIAQALALRGDLPVLLCSGNRDDLAALSAVQGVAALPKPFDQAALRRAIIAVLGNEEGES